MTRTELKDLLQGVKQGSGGQALGPFNLVFELGDFFKGKNKERLIIIL